MTWYFSWNPKIETELRQLYLDWTGEAIQDTTSNAAIGDVYVGSSRLTDEHKQMLKDRFGDDIDFTTEPQKCYDIDVEFSSEFSKDFR